jgi:hypothetical protein
VSFGGEHNVSSIHNQDAGCGAQSLFEIMCREDHRPPGLYDFIEHFVEHGDGLDVEPRIGFIEKNELGIVQQNTRNSDALL